MKDYRQAWLQSHGFHSEPVYCHYDATVKGRHSQALGKVLRLARYHALIGTEVAMIGFGRDNIPRVRSRWHVVQGRLGSGTIAFRRTKPAPAGAIH